MTLLLSDLQLDQLTEELQVVQAERQQSPAEQVEDLLSRVASVSAERDQLRLDLQMVRRSSGSDPALRRADLLTCCTNW